LAFALIEDEDKSTGYIGVPPPCTARCMHVVAMLSGSSAMENACSMHGKLKGETC